MFPIRDSIRSHSVAFITWAIIIGNCIVFLGEIFMPRDLLPEFIETFGVVPAVFLANPSVFAWGTILSSMFIHAGWGHLLGNIWFLHVFGNHVEEKVGHIRYLLLYLFTGICACMAHVCAMPHSNLPVVGASGAISGVLGAYIVFFPSATVTTLFPMGIFTRIVELPAYFYLGSWFVVQLVIGSITLNLQNTDEPQVAFVAHIGGFIIGWLIGKMIESK